MITDYIYSKVAVYENEPFSIFLMMLMIFCLPFLCLTFVLDVLLFPIELIIFIIKENQCDDTFFHLI